MNTGLRASQPALLCALLALIGAAASHAHADTPAGPSAPPPAVAAREDPALAADLSILARLDVPFPAPRSFRDATAREVIDAAAKASGYAVEIDSQIVGESGGWELIRLSCDARTPREALDAVAQAISTSYRRMELDVVAGIPVFCEHSRATRLVALKRYDLQPILSRLEADRAAGADDDARAALVTDIIEEGVDPDGWVDNGGNISRHRVIGRTLVVWTTPARHHAVARLLGEIAAALPSPSLLWKIRVATVAPDADAASVDEALGSAAGLDALLAAGAAKLLSSPQLVALRGQEASVSVGSDAEGIEVRIAPGGSRDASLVEVRHRSGERTLTAAIRAVERIRGVGLVAADGVRLLVEVLCVDAPEPEPSPEAQPEK